MTIYLTVKDLTLIFKKTDKTILRWREGSDIKPIVLDGKQYIPEKDPGGRCWRFKVIPAQENK